MIERLSALEARVAALEEGTLDKRAAQNPEALKEAYDDLYTDALTVNPAFFASNVPRAAADLDAPPAADGAGEVQALAARLADALVRVAALEQQVAGQQGLQQSAQAAQGKEVQALSVSLFALSQQVQAVQHSLAADVGALAQQVNQAQRKRARYK